MVVEFYMSPLSPPSRAVWLGLKCLGVPHRIHELNVMEKHENMTPEYGQINPARTVPCIVDDGFALWESRAILVYLCEKYGRKECPLYPRDPEVQGQIHKMLNYDMGSLYESITKWMFPIVLHSQPPNAEAFAKMEADFRKLDDWLSHTKFVAGDTMTIADISILASITTTDFMDLDFSSFPRIQEWMSTMKKTFPFFWREIMPNSDDIKQVLKAKQQADQ